MFGIGGTELLIVAVFAFIIFGPDKIPEIARTVSKAINMFKRTQEDMERLVKAEMMGVDPDKRPLLADDAAAGQGSSGEQPAVAPSKASSLYGIVDEEEEDEE